MIIIFASYSTYRGLHTNNNNNNNNNSHTEFDYHIHPSSFFDLPTHWDRNTIL